MAGLLQDSYWFSNAGGFEIGQSLRFRGAQSLTRTTIPSPTDYQNYTFSCWVKRSTLDDSYYLFNGGSSNFGGFPYDGGVVFNASNNARSYNFSNLVGSDAVSPGVYRDPSAWYHVVGNMLNSVTTTVYVNGVQQATNTSTSSSAIGTLPQAVGASAIYTTNWLEGYMCEVYFIDGQTLAPDNFGEYNPQGVWVPKKYEGTYGNSGFYLDFADPNNIGTDRSGNGNDFTATGFELTNTTSALYDWFTDSPTTNSALWNPLDGSTRTTFVAANSNAQRTSSTTYGQSVSSTQYPDGKVSYSEHYMGSVGADFGTTPNNYVGVGNYIYGVNSSNQNGFDTGLITYYEDGDIYIDGAFASTGIAYTSNCTIGVKVDRSVTPNTVQFYKDGTASGSASSLGTGDILYGNAYTRNVSNPNLNGNVTWNGGGQPWQYAPSGITEDNAITVKNLPAVTIPNPSDHFDVITDTGANILTAAQTKFSNGLWIVKDAVNTSNWQWVDSLRGNQAWASNLALPQSTYAAPSGSSIAYCWKTVETFTGTGITAGERNVLAGFSMVTYTGDSTQPRAIPHGLGKKPGHVIVKAISGASYPGTTQFASFGPSYYNQMNSPNTGGTSTVWANTDMDATNFYVGNNIWSNVSGVTYVAYIWAPIEGYSHECKVQFNGTADGPFEYMGFSPAFSLIKLMVNGTTGPWEVNSTGLNQYNPIDMAQSWESTSSSYGSNYPSDFVSNGVKHLSPYSNTFEYGYMAFAKHPFGGSNVSPATAR